MPRELEDRYIEVNVPAQSLRYIADGEAVLDSRVVIGRKNSRTPIMRTLVTSVVANPPWDIPDDIAARKILPKLRQSSNYLAGRDMVLIDGPADDPRGEHIDWRHVDGRHLPFQIRQNPGGSNALGSLMLDSPNQFDVYMHDTPSKHLFTLDDREVSNGCIRVQRIFTLASLALKNDLTEAIPELTAAVETKETQHIALDTPLPAYVVYWTAVPNTDGTITFLPDLYGRDRRLIERLTSRS
jgi:murein L,D-transpeptidase YcbB/YkuD